MAIVIEGQEIINSGNTRATSIVVNTPANAAIGEWLIMIVAFESFSNTTVATTPTGYSKISSAGNSGNGLYYNWYARKVDETEGATVTVDYDASVNSAVWLMRISGLNQYNPFADGGANAGGLTGANLITSNNHFPPRPNCMHIYAIMHPTNANSLAIDDTYGTYPFPADQAWQTQSFGDTLSATGFSMIIPYMITNTDLSDGYPVRITSPYSEAWRYKSNYFTPPYCNVISRTYTLDVEKTLTLTGRDFGDTQTTAKVYISDVELAGGANEVDISSAVTSWDNENIVADLSLLSPAIKTSLEAFIESVSYVIVDTPDNFEDSRTVKIYDVQDISFAGNGGSSTTTTPFMAAPTGMTDVDMDRAAYEGISNPSDAVGMNTSLKWTEQEFILKVNATAPDGEVYEFRTRISSGDINPVYTSIPELTIYTVDIVHAGFRFREDDDDEANATWIDTQDTNVSFETGRKFRLRFYAQFKNGSMPSGVFYLEVKKKSDPDTEWRKIEDTE
jgi:hypothetical protein